MAAKDLMFKVAIFDDTKKDLENIKKNLKELEDYALGVSRGVTTAVRSIKEIDNGFKLNVPDLTSFAEQIGKIDKALGKKDAFKVKDLEDALNTIKKFGEQLGEVPIKRNALAETLNNMSSQVETGAKKMGTATTASLETYRDQLKAASKDIETNIGIIRERINAAFNNGNLTPKGGADLRSLFGFNAAVSDRAVSEFVRGFEGTLTRVQEKLKSYDKSVVNNQYLVGDIGKIKEELGQLESAVTAVRNGLSSKGILGNMPDNTNKQISELTNIIGKLDALEQKLQSFGNGTYPDVMRGFITAVDNAVKQVSEKLRGLDEVKPNVNTTSQNSNPIAEKIKGDEASMREALQLLEKSYDAFNKRYLELKVKLVSAVTNGTAASNNARGLSPETQDAAFKKAREQFDALQSKVQLFQQVADKLKGGSNIGAVIKELKDTLGSRDLFNQEQVKSDASKMVTPFEEVQQRIHDIIERIKQDVSGGLKDALNTDISATKTVQSLNELANGLSGLESVLAKSKETAAQIKEATATLQGAKENMAALKGGGIVNTNSGVKTADNEEGVKAETYVRNINLITNAILQLSRAYTTAAEARTKIAANGGDTSGVDKYLAMVQNYIKQLGELRTRTDVIGQKGMMLTDPENIQRLADILSSTTMEAKQLLSVINALGSATPKGEMFQKLMASANMFKLDAKEIETAAKLRDTSLSNVERRKILSKALEDITSLRDINVLRLRVPNVTDNQLSQMLGLSGVAKSIQDIQAFKNKMDALSESELNQKGKVANLQAEYNKLTSIYRKHLSQLNQLATAQDRATARGAVSDIHSVDLATRKYAELTNKVAEYKQTVDAAQGMKLTSAQAQDLQAFENYIRELETTIKRLQQIMQSGGVDISGANAKQVLNGDFAASAINASKFNKEFKREVRENSKEYQDASKRVESALTKIATLRASLVSAEKGSMVNGKDVVSIANLKDLFNQLLELKNKLSNPDKITAASYLTKDYDLLVQKINEAIKLQNQAVNYKSKVDSKLDPLEQFISEYQKTLNRGTGLGIDQSSLDNLNSYIQRLQALRDEIINLNGKDYLDTTRMQGLIESYNQLKTATKSVAAEVEKLSAKQESLNNKQKKADDRKTQQDIDKRLNSWDKAVEKVETYRNKLKDAKKTLADAKDANSRLGKNIDVTDLEAYVQRLRQVVTLLDEIRASGSRVGATKNGQFYGEVVNSTFRGEVKAGDYNRREVSQQVTAALNEEKKATREAEQAKRQSAQASEQLAKSENSVAQAIANSTNSARNQSQVLSDLKSMAAQYLSVWGAQQFISDMTHITGELELQERSLEVILGNASAAREMYSQIRDLSQMSPYSFEDLLKSHRQLAAFGIEAKDIFGTLKSLSDIGAGLDVDVSRLILAYGHTKSYGYLSGIQNRQFETAGIDLVGALTQHYNKLAEAEKKAGNSAQFVTRADIFQRMRSRSIPFEEVEKVIMDLDKPGGKFYNMQIKQYETLGGKLRNLRNNYRIMMSELGESNHGLLEGTVNIINELTANWQKYARIIKGVIAGYATMKVAALLAGKGVLAANKQIYLSAANSRASKLSTTYLNNPTSSWWKPNMSAYSVPLGNVEPSPGEFRNLKDGEDFKKLNNLQKQRIALTGKFNDEQRKELLIASGVKPARAEEINQMASWQRGVMSLRLGFIQAGQAFKAFALSMLYNPMTWITLAIAGITALASKISDMQQNAETLKNNLGDAAKTNIEGIKQSLSEYEGMFQVREGAPVNTFKTNEGSGELHYVDLDKAAMEGQNLVEMFDDLRKKLESQSPIYDKDFYNINKAEDQASRIQESFNTLKRLQYVNQVVDASKSDVEGAMKEGAPKHWYSFWDWGKGEDYMTNAKDYQDTYQEFVNSFSIDDNNWSKLTKDQQSKIEAYVKALGVTRKDAAVKYLINTNDIGAASALGASTGTLSDIVNSGWDNQEINSKSKDVIRIATSLSNTMMSAFKGNTPAMSEYFGQMMNQMMSDAKVGDPEVQQKLADEMAEAVYNVMARVNWQEATDFYNTYMEQKVGSEVNKRLQDTLTPNMNTADAQKKTDETMEAVLKEMQISSPKFAAWWKKQGKQAQDNFRREWQKSAKGIQEMMLGAQAWQKQAYEWHMPINIKTDVDYTQFVQDTRKRIKEAEEKLKANTKRIQFLLGVDVLPDFQFKDSKSAQKFARSLSDAGAKLGLKATEFKLRHSDNNWRMSEADEKIYNNLKAQSDSLLDYANIVQSIVTDMTGLENWHQDIYENTGKGKSGGGKKNTRKTGGTHSYTDEFAKRWDERIRIMKEANEWYEKWKKELGDTAAIDRVSEKYGDIFKEWRTDKLLPMNFDVKDIADIEKYVKKINKDAMARYKMQKNSKKFNNGQEALRVARTAHDVLEDIQYEKFTKTSTEWASKESLYLDRLTKQWDLYSKIRKSTGDQALAVRMSGFSGNTFTNEANALRHHIAEEISGFKLKDKNDAILNINFADVLGRSDEQIEDKVKNLFGNNEKYSVQIKAIVADLKKWRDIQQQALDEGAETYANLIGSVDTYDNTIKKLNDDLEDTINKLQTAKSNGIISQSDYNRGVGIKTAQTDLKKYEATAATQLYMGANINALTRNQAETIYKKYIDLLNNAFKKGAISAKDYADKVKKVNEQYGKIKSGTSDVSALITSGFDGLINNRKQRGEDMVEAGSKQYDEAKSAYDVANRTFDINNPEKFDMKGAIDAKSAMDTASDAMSKGGSMLQGAGQAAATVAIIDKVIKTINANVQSLKALFDDIANTIDTFGGDAEKFKSSGGYSFISGFASASQGATDAWNSLKSGNAMGVLEGGYRSIMSFPEAFARAHDARRQRKIDKLNEHVSAIEGYTETIAKAQERTLGYDYGDVIRSYQQQYRQNMTAIKTIFGTIRVSNEGRAGQAMAAYYDSAGANTDLNGYQQQYNLLIAKRKDYIDMYNAEASKKKKSNSALQEYKEKIADLDDQIRYFGQDLAKNLWDIDLKSWADQLGDALMSAFENGEDAAKAFDDSVRSILQGVFSKMLKLQILEPMFQNLQDKLFGNKDKGTSGIFDPNDIVGSSKKVAQVITDFFGTNGEGRNTITAARQFYNGVNLGLSNAGLTLDNDSSSTLSSGISSASEDSVNVFSGYVASLRQDVSIIRLQDSMFYNETLPDYIKTVTAGVSSLQNIDTNVQAIRMLMSENGSLYEQIRTLRDDVHGIVTQQKSVRMA